MKRTADKVSRYYNGILAMLVLDAIQISGFIILWRFNEWDLYTFPVFTFLGVGFVAAIEIKSIYEPADAKEAQDMKDAIELAKAIAEHKDDPKQLAEVIAEYVNNKGKEEKS